LPILKKAVESLVKMKAKEGANIVHEISRSLKKIKGCLDDIERIVPRRNAHYKKHLMGLVQGIRKELSEERLYQELLYVAERTDVTEECKRLHSHLQLFNESMTKDDNPGRRLNFLLQEMQREANTLSVKANHLRISKKVVDIKEEIEKIREQVQNLE
jgi:uncharacterized protein (TIGR00255 family)